MAALPHRSEENPWTLKTPPGPSAYTKHTDEQDGRRILVCAVGLPLPSFPRATHTSPRVVARSFLNTNGGDVCADLRDSGSGMADRPTRRLCERCSIVSVIGVRMIGACGPVDRWGSGSID